MNNLQVEAFARDFWDFCNSLGFRMDRMEQFLERVQARLWKLESGQRKEHRSNISDARKHLIDQARARHGHVEPCAGRNWGECFTVIEGRLALWYNDARGSTHMELSREGGSVFETQPADRAG